MDISRVFNFLKFETPADVFSFLGTIAIFIAAIAITSKKAVKPKVKIGAFISYIGACIFLGIMGVLMNNTAGDWLIIQQVFLFFVNIRGIINAIKQLKTINTIKKLKLYNTMMELKYGKKDRS